MPTGYTSKIVDGKITTLKDFAMVCSKAFLIHERDSDSDDISHIEPSDHYNKKIQQTKSDIDKLNSKFDGELIQEEKERLENRKVELKNIIDDKNELSIKLNKMLSDAKNFKIPTEDHKGIADFMIQQLESTIEADCDTKYYYDGLDHVNFRLSVLNADVLRMNIKKELEDNLITYTKYYEEELERCFKTNKWIDELKESLK